MDRMVHTKLYSKIAYEVIDSVFGQLSDGWGENSPYYEKYWKFAKAKVAPDGEVVIAVDINAYKPKLAGGYPHRSWPHYVDNAFCHMSDSEVLAKVAGWVKKTVQMELKDKCSGAGSPASLADWKRDNTRMFTQYLNRDEDISVAQVYCIYEALLGREARSAKYAASVISSVFGSKRTDEETAAEEKRIAESKKKLEAYMKEHDEVVRWMLAQKQAVDREVANKIEALKAKYSIDKEVQ